MKRILTALAVVVMLVGIATPSMAPPLYSPEIMLGIAQLALYDCWGRERAVGTPACASAQRLVDRRQAELAASQVPAPTPTPTPPSGGSGSGTAAPSTPAQTPPSGGSSTSPTGGSNGGSGSGPCCEEDADGGEDSTPVTLYPVTIQCWRSYLDSIPVSFTGHSERFARMQAEGICQNKHKGSITRPFPTSYVAETTCWRARGDSFTTRGSSDTFDKAQRAARRACVDSGGSLTEPDAVVTVTCYSLSSGLPSEITGRGASESAAREDAEDACEDADGTLSIPPIQTPRDGDETDLVSPPKKKPAGTSPPAPTVPRPGRLTGDPSGGGSGRVTSPPPAGVIPGTGAGRGSGGRGSGGRGTGRR